MLNKQVKKTLKKKGHPKNLEATDLLQAELGWCHFGFSHYSVVSTESQYELLIDLAKFSLLMLFVI